MAEKKDKTNGMNGDKQSTEPHDEYEYLNLVKKIIETGSNSYNNIFEFTFQ